MTENTIAAFLVGHLAADKLRAELGIAETQVDPITTEISFWAVTLTDRSCPCFYEPEFPFKDRLDYLERGRCKPIAGMSGLVV